MASGVTVTPTYAADGTVTAVASPGAGDVSVTGTLSAETSGGTPGTLLVQGGMGSGTVTLGPTAVLDASAPNGGNGGAITVNAHTVVLDEIAPLNVSAPSGTPGRVSIDPAITDVGTASALETIDGSQSAYLNNASVCIALTANIDMETGTTPYSWIPLGTSSTSAFTGTFNGNGHTVSGYTITATGNNGTGFIGYLGSGGTVENLGVSGTVNGGSYCLVGGVVGINFGTVEKSYNTGSVSGGGSYIGGVIGDNDSGTVTNVTNTGSVTGGSGSNDVGGGIGASISGTVDYSTNTGTVK